MMNEAEPKTQTPPQVSPPGPVKPPQMPDHELLHRIGRGSYGEVWLARGVTGAYRAVKIVRRESFEHERPFEREFSGILQFEPISRIHESQVDILHVGRGEGYFYYVMELADDQLTGQRINPDGYAPRTLKSELFQRGRLPFDECVQISIALTTALENLHSHVLAHRDVKPSNIIFINGVPKLADIGLVTSVDATRSHVGTEGFAPPEGPGSEQADLYSLGKVLYEMATGKDRQDFPELPTNLAELPDCEGLVELNAVIAKACRQNVRERYQSAQEMHKDLLLLQSGKSLARVRTLERRLTKLKQASMAVAVVTVLATAAWFYQSRQTRQMKKLATDNLDLAQKSQLAAEESRQGLLKLQVATGARLMGEGDLSSSLSWFAEALKSTQGDPNSEETHRYRLGTLFRYSPKPVALFLHDAFVARAWLSPDEQRLISICIIDNFNDKGRRVRIWDAVTAEVLFTLTATNSIFAAVSRDGRTILTAHEDFSARIWDGVTGKLVGTPLTHSNTVLYCNFSPDGSRVATASADRTARIWDVATATLVVPPLQHSNAVHFVAFSRDGSRIVTGSGGVPGIDRFGAARVWNTTNGEPVTGWLEQDNPVSTAEFSPDGRKVVTAGDSEVSITSRPSVAKVWDSATGRLLFPPLKHRDSILRATFSPDGRYIAIAGTDSTAMIWNAHSGEPVGFPLKHGDLMRRAVFSPDGRWLATAAGTTARLWDVATGELVTSPLKHSHVVTDVAFSPDGTRLVTASVDHLVRFWNVVASEPALPLLSDPTMEGIRSASFSTDGRRVVTATWDGSIQLWQADTGQPIMPFMNPARLAPNRPAFTTIHPPVFITLAAAFGPDGKRIVAPFGDSTARIWDAEAGKPATPPLYHSNTVFQAAFSPDSRHVVTASGDSTARVWDAGTGQPVTPPLRHTSQVLHASFSPDGHRVVTASYDKTVRVWDATTGAPLTPPLQHALHVNWAAFSPDGRRIVTAGGDATALILDADTGAKVVGPIKHTAVILRVAFSPDGHRIVTASMDNTARVWDATTGHPITPPLKHGGYVYQASFSPDGRRVVTASSDWTARIWDATTGEALSPAFKHRNHVLDACFSPDGQRILTASMDATAQIWEAPKTDWSIEDVTMLAELLAGGAIDPSGNPGASSPETLQKIWRSLRSRHPQEFNTRPEDLLLWHRRQLVRSELSRQWFAALFHVDRLIALAPDDSTLQGRRAQILAAQPPPRDPDASPDLIDLSDSYNASLSVAWRGGWAGNNLTDLPRGVQKLAGVEFDIRGLIQVFKNREDESKWGFPERINGVRIGRKLKRVHFLHSSCEGIVPDGTKIGSYVLHFGNGLQKEIPIIYGHDVRDWWSPEGGASEKIHSEIAWNGSNEASRKQGRSIRLFKSTWKNEFPDVEIDTLDIVSDSDAAAPFLIALTVE